VAETVIDERSASAIAKELGRSFAGEVLIAGQPGYDEARTIWNAMVAKRPAVVARCATTEDVVASVNLARSHGLQVSVRCGGHGVTGKAITDGGLTIDLTRMRGVEVHAGQERYDRLARVNAQYDPDNFFRSNNASIAPASSGTASPPEHR